jgi:hypothetical protein
VTDRDRRILRRALLAGGAVALVLGGLFGLGLSGGGVGASVAGMWLGIALGGFVAAGWLLLALGLDVAAREKPTRARVLWTEGVSAVALLLPLVALSAAGAAAGGG